MMQLQDKQASQRFADVSKPATILLCPRGFILWHSREDKLAGTEFRAGLGSDGREETLRAMGDIVMLRKRRVFTTDWYDKRRRFDMKPCDAASVAIMARVFDVGNWHKLTQRERDVALALAQDPTVRKAARRIGISMSTIETHRSNIYRKLGVASPTELCRLAVRCGLVEP